MEHWEYIDAITAESNALAYAAAEAGMDAPVPSCPGWTVKDLVVHDGLVQRWATEIVRTKSTERPGFGDRPAIPDDELTRWYRDGAVALAAELTRADPATPVWTFGADQTVAFWLRRQAQETAVHRWDAENAAGDLSPLSPKLAVDGIDEWLGFLVARGASLSGQGETIHLHCTDTEGVWLITRAPDGVTVERAHAKGDVAARGTASDLDLYLWGRVPAGALEVFGDPALLESFRALGAR
jgi:uncharacterized protein (TIGR03083 family)